VHTVCLPERRGYFHGREISGDVIFTIYVLTSRTLLRFGSRRGGVGIDTAYYYGNQADIAAGLAAAGAKRSDVFLTTKIPAGSYEKATADIESDLKALGVEQVDLMLIHHPCSGTSRNTGDDEAACSTADTWKALTEAKAAGKTRAIGVSHFTQKDLEALSSVPSTNANTALNCTTMRPSSTANLRASPTKASPHSAVAPTEAPAALRAARACSSSQR
jgi:aryl-alcohol dehydrogenase-like predicted oxidoreductase